MTNGTPSSPGNWTLVKDTDSLKHATVSLAGKRLLALDVETEGLDPHLDKVVLLGLGDMEQQVLVDCRRVSLEPLRPLLSGSTVKVTHNGAFDLSMLRARGVRCENVADTMLNEQVLENGRRSGSVSLAALADKYLGIELPKEQRLTFASTEGEFTRAQLEYLRRDLLATYQLLLEQVPRLEREQVESTARLEATAVPVFADLRYDGIYLDARQWAEIVEEAKHRRQQLRDEIDKLLAPVCDVDLFGNVSINYESEQELKKALEKLAGRALPDVSKHTLLRIGHPAGKLLVQYREQSKIVTTYGQNFLEFIHPRTGRIHAEFHQIGAPTGRVSCSNPNLQNIPRGSRFRRCFRAPDGRKLITADYSGCELRILAELSQDDSFLRIFNSGGDLHSMVASEIFGRTVSKSQNPELRNRAKAINFGLAYGMGAGGLAQVTGLSLEAAEQLLNRYFRAYPKVKRYLDESAEVALRRGWASTIGGRKLYLQDTDDPQKRAALARVVKNMPIQGTNADMLKLAMAGIRRRLLDESLDAFIVNCVHDEIVVEASEDSAWDVAEVVEQEMVRAGERFIKSVPVEVEVSVGDYWQK